MTDPTSHGSAPPSVSDPSTPRNGDSPLNRLGGESSAYLRQHQYNPVDWYPWGAEALERARREDRPILVSIGYSACHWCHVMERESFENPEIAARLNEAFVCIKVDREERPDVDQIYMKASMTLNGSGGWPLNAICTPDGRPFFVGTYFPPARQGNRPSFVDVIDSLSTAWREQRDVVEQNAGQIAEALDVRVEGGATPIDGPHTIRRAAEMIMRSADSAHGGFGQAPKFPMPTNLEFLTAALDFVPNEDATNIARFLSLTAREMSRRGLFDQLGGGFHRYCTDGNWTIPHFEKMLYDQGQLLSFYAELARRAHDPGDLTWPIVETVDYLRREMLSASGAFYASQDADSEGVEGKFFVWTPQQIAEHLGDEADPFCTQYGVRLAGNFEDGTTHLVDEARGPREELAGARGKLLKIRSTRIPPDTDPKHVAAWNGYVISGLARSASATGDLEMRADAARAADFVLGSMRDASGHLQRVYHPNAAAQRPDAPGFLDDYAALLSACLDLHRSGAGEHYLEAAQELADQILQRFADQESGTLFLTHNEDDQLIHRPQPDQDGATPDAAGLALLGLARLEALSHSAELDAFVEQAIAKASSFLEREPHAYPTLLRVIALRTRGTSVAVIIGDPEASETEALAARARRVLRPEDAVLVARPGAPVASGLSPDWFLGREAIDGRATAYVCRGSVCSLPVQVPAQLVADLVPEA
jgi:uncharacterized protein YyaL (SSP411 family)